MTLAYSYVRMSTERQIKGDSLRRQLDWSAAFAQRNSLVLDDSLRDIGVSAWKGKHRKKGALGEFLRMVEDGVVPRGSYLLVESLDRLSREDVMAALQQFIGILQSGIVIATMDPEQVYHYEGLKGEFSQLIIALTFMSRANEESERKSSRIRQALSNKRMLAQAGQRNTFKTPTWITATPAGNNTYTYALNERAAVLREVFEMSADGLGIDRIARVLNAKGVRTFGGGSAGWWSTTVRNLLQSRTAIGEYQPIETRDDQRVLVGDPIANYYPAAVDHDLWQRAQKTAIRRKAGRRGEDYNNLFQDLSVCTHCGQRMYFRNSGPKANGIGYRYYLVCHSGSRGGECKHGTSSFYYEHVENSILDHVQDFRFIDMLRAQKRQNALQEVEQRLAEARRSLELEQGKANNVIEAISTVGVSALLVEKLQSLEGTVAAEKANVAALTLQRDQEAAKARVDDPTDIILALRGQWNSTEDSHERYTLRSRVGTALQRVVSHIAFDHRANTFTVILVGGKRAFQFDNASRFLPKPQPPRAVDMMPFAPNDAMALTHSEHAVLSRTPVNGKLENIRDGAVFIDVPVWEPKPQQP